MLEKTRAWLDEWGRFHMEELAETMFCLALFWIVLLPYTIWRIFVIAVCYPIWYLVTKRESGIRFVWDWLVVLPVLAGLLGSWGLYYLITTPEDTLNAMGWFPVIIGQLTGMGLTFFLAGSLDVLTEGDWGF